MHENQHENQYENQRWTLAARPQGEIKHTDFRLETAPVLACEEGQILVRVRYVSVDPAMRGWVNAGTTYIKGVELGAVMRAFAAGVGEFVSGMFGVQTYAVSSGAGVEHLFTTSPDALPRYLGTLGMPGMTAYWGLLDKGQPQSGETVLVSGAAGAVGSLVGQIAKIRGCTTIGIAGGAEKCRLLTEELGFDAAIDYKSENIVERLKTLAPHGVDVYFDNVGGDTLNAALAHLARGARVVICGAISQYNNADSDGNPAPPQGPKNYMKIVTARGVMNGIIVLDYFDRADEFRSQMEAWLEAGAITSREHIVNGIEQFPAALLMLFRGENMGKLALSL
jgi:NADPH-dependent curcumin reductase